MQHILNVIKDIFDPRDHVVAPNAPSSSVDISFRSKVPYIKDQGALGSCTSFAGTEHFELQVRAKASDVPLAYDRSKIRLSPLFQYGQERIAEGTFTRDAGANSRTIFKVLTSVGCCLEQDDAYIPSNAFVLPTSAQVAEAANFKFQAYHRILDVPTAKTVLTSGYTFTVGMPLFSQFESDQAATDGLIAMPSGSAIGGHEMHIVGADDSKQVLGQIGAFEAQNSWGAGWGDSGFCWIPYSYFDAVAGEWDFWMGHFGSPWRPEARPSCYAKDQTPSLIGTALR